MKVNYYLNATHFCECDTASYMYAVLENIKAEKRKYNTQYFNKHTKLPIRKSKDILYSLVKK